MVIIIIMHKINGVAVAYLTATFLFFVGVFLPASLWGMDAAQLRVKPLVIILTSNGGGGHKSASTAIAGYLEKDFTVEEKYVLEDSLPSALNFFGIKGESSYNSLVRYTQNCTVLNAIFQVGQAYFKLCAKSIEQDLSAYLEEKKPAMVISVVPIVNSIVFFVTARLKIPFLLSPTDIDARTFLLDVDASGHPCFAYNKLFEDEAIQKSLNLARIEPQSTVQIGFPLRSDFYESKDLVRIAQDYNLDLSRPVILVMMGSQASPVIIEYVRHLTQVSRPCHFIICIGANESLRPMIEKEAVFKEGVTYKIQGMTPRISDLMAIASLFITKSGTASVCEAIQMKLPMLLDATTPLIEWEKYNHEFVARHNLGVSIDAYEMIAPIVESMLCNQTYKSLRQNFDKLAQQDTPTKFRDLALSRALRHELPPR